MSRIRTLTLLCAAPIVGCSPGGPAGLQPTAGAPVVLISIDTLRADHLSCYGYERRTSPNIDRLARESVRFERTYALSNNTAPSHMTMLTGLVPDAHGVRHDEETALAPDVPYLADILDRAGYATAGFADGGMVAAPFGFARGFDLFESGYELFDHKVSHIEQWLEHAPNEGAFLFVHTYGVHAPYMPAQEHDRFTRPKMGGALRQRMEGLRGTREALSREGGATELTLMRNAFWIKRVLIGPRELTYLKDLYDGCISEVDEGIGRLLDLLDEAGWLERGWVVLTSDHGEAFREHGTFEHRQLYEEELRVPLIIRPPGGLPEPLVIERRVQLLDLAPTVLACLDLPVPGLMQGSPLLWSADGEDATFMAVAGEEVEYRAVVEGPHKLMLRREGPVELYDLPSDPAEEHNLIGEPEYQNAAIQIYRQAAAMREEAEALRELLGEPTGLLDLDERTREELEFLGYTGGD